MIKISIHDPAPLDKSTHSATLHRAMIACIMELSKNVPIMVRERGVNYRSRTLYYKGKQYGQPKPKEVKAIIYEGKEEDD